MQLVLAIKWSFSIGREMLYVLHNDWSLGGGKECIEWEKTLVLVHPTASIPKGNLTLVGNLLLGGSRVDTEANAN